MDGLQSPPEGKTPAYRLFYVPELSYELKNIFLMSYACDIEVRLRKNRDPTFIGIEDEIPFWEFLNIEYEREAKTFYLIAYYKVKPAFQSFSSIWLNRRYFIKSMSYQKNHLLEYIKQIENQE